MEDREKDAMENAWESAEDIRKGRELALRFLKEGADSPWLTKEYLKALCKAQQKYLPNVDFPTAGGKTFWDTLAERDGWKIQQNKITCHIRILNSHNTRKAWGTPKQLLKPILEHIREQEARARTRPRLGIVFCGGGAKGAYQIGVWRRLREQGLEPEINGVSGASIGALNSLLFTQGDLELAEEIWRSIRQGDLMRPGKSPLGLFSRRFLKEIIDQHISPQKVMETDRLVYTALAALAVPHVPSRMSKPQNFVCSVEYPCWSGLSFKDIRKRVLASAAMPVAYSPMGWNDKIYIDGGVMDNHPVRPLLEAGFPKILVVHLSQPDEDREKKLRKMDGRAEGASLIHICPSKSLGDTLEISREWTDYRMELGYQDACAQLEALTAAVPAPD